MAIREYFSTSFSKKLFKKTAIWSAVLIVATIPIGCRLWQLHNYEVQVKNTLNDFVYNKIPVTIIGVIDVEPDIKPATQDFTVHVQSISATSDSNSKTAVDTRIMVSEKIYPQFSYGDEISLNGKLIVPRNFSDGDSREFDYVHYLSKDGIFFLMKNPKATVIATRKGNPLFAKLFAVKESFLENIRRVLGEPQASLAAGEIVGDKASLGKDLTDDFRRSGLIHIVILSGYSIAIIADSIQRMLSVVPYLPRSVSLFFGAFGILLFGIMIGGKATAVRACIMAIMSIAAKIMYRDYHALRALILTAYIMIVQNPYIVLYDASFQVSFTATLGLILLGKHIEGFLKKFPRLFPERFEIRALVTSTLATQIAVAPLLLYMMGDASVVGLIANVIVVPFIPLTLLAIFCTGMFGFVAGTIGYYASTAIAAISHILLSYELWVVQFFGTFPYAIITINNFSLWMMWGVYALYAVGYFILKKKTGWSHADITQPHPQNSSRSPPS